MSAKQNGGRFVDILNSARSNVPGDGGHVMIMIKAKQSSRVIWSTTPPDSKDLGIQID